MLDKIKKYRHHAKELLTLALPLIMGNIGFIMIGAGDVFVAAKYSTDALASISIANSIVSCIFMFGIGLLISVSPILSNVRGQRKSAKKFFFPTVRFSMLSAFVTLFVIWATIPLIDLMGFEAKLVPAIKEYIFIIAFSVFGGYLHAALKEFLQAYEIVFFPNFVTIVSIFLNLALNWIFVFGLGPIPSMGVKGLAIASVIVRVIMGLAVLGYCFYYFKFRNHHDRSYYKHIVKVGLPISFAISIEFLAFNGMTLLLGRVSGLYAAAQNIIIIITSVAFMVPLALSNAIAIKVGFSNGARNLTGIKRYSIIGILMCVSFMLLSGLICASFPRPLARIFTQDMQLINIIAPVMILVGCFQVFDGLQVALGGIFKGIKQTKLIFATNFIGYILIGFPLGVLLAFHFKYYFMGFWVGFLAGPITICLMLFVVMMYKYKHIKAEWGLKSA